MYDGTLTVQRMVSGGDWKTIATANAAYRYDSTGPVGNATYRVLYSGSGDYAPSNAAVTGRAQRKLDLSAVSGKRAAIGGTVSRRSRRSGRTS